jgi:uncharacterized protein YbjT (DUF2867 family)
MSQTVAIFGATGAQGSPVVREALAKGHTVRAIARDAARTAQMHPDAQPIAASLDDEEALAAALDGVDAAFVHFPMPATPEDPANWMKALFAAAHRVSLPLMVYSTSGTAGSRYPSSVMIDASTAGMQAVLGSGIPSIVLQPTVYLENLLPGMFIPRLRSEGVLDYPPLPENQKVTWTSHLDQARVAVAALSRPDLAGNSYEIGSPGAFTGGELAALLADFAGRDTRFDPLTPEAFGQRVADAFGNPGVGYVLTDLYTALSSMPEGGLEIDTAAIERTFDVSLTTVADHVKTWAPQTAEV